MIYIRADGNTNIGMGHLVRCMSISLKLRYLTGICFLTSDEMSVLEIKKQGFDVKKLNSEPYSDAEVQEIKDLVFEEREPVIAMLIDSYSVSEAYLSGYKGWLRIALMDDMIKDAFSVDMIINYNTYASSDLYYKLYAGQMVVPELVLGGRYVPLRDQFAKGAKATANINPEVKDILISAGGADINNLSGEIADRLLNYSAGKGIRLHVVCGGFNPNYDKLTEMSEKNDNIIVHRAVENMAELMKKCDIAISAGGSTCYELCSMGIPFVTFAFVENQLGIIADMEKRGVAYNAGFISSKDNRDRIVDSIFDKAVALSESYEDRLSMSKRGKELVDGMGARRIAEKLYFFKEG